MIAKIINSIFYTVCILLIIGLFVVFGSKTAKACDEDDLTEISLKEYYICYGGWCERSKR